MSSQNHKKKHMKRNQIGEKKHRQVSSSHQYKHKMLRTHHEVRNPVLNICMNTYVHGKCQKLCTRHLILPNQFGPKNHHPHRCMVSVCQSILTSLVTGANHVTATAMVIAPCERWSSTRDALLLGHDLWSNCIAFLPWTVI